MGYGAVDFHYNSSSAAAAFASNTSSGIRCLVGPEKPYASATPYQGTGERDSGPLSDRAVILPPTLSQTFSPTVFKTSQNEGTLTSHWMCAMASQISLATRCGAPRERDGQFKAHWCDPPRSPLCREWVVFLCGWHSIVHQAGYWRRASRQRRRRFGSFANGMIYPCLPGPRLMLSFMVGSTSGQ